MLGLDSQAKINEKWVFLTWQNQKKKCQGWKSKGIAVVRLEEWVVLCRSMNILWTWLCHCRPISTMHDHVDLATRLTNLEGGLLCHSERSSLEICYVFQSGISGSIHHFGCLIDWEPCSLIAQLSRNSSQNLRYKDLAWSSSSYRYYTVRSGNHFKIIGIISLSIHNHTVHKGQLYPFGRVPAWSPF